MSKAKATKKVSAELFRQVYDSPGSLPGRQKWVTSDADVRKIEEILGVPRNTIGVPLWVSGDSRSCRKCGRETNWLDIVTSALSGVHSRQMIARVILGEAKFVNVEAPRAIGNLHCSNCRTAISDLRSFKCHNWAYAIGAMREVVEKLKPR
jgi:hypothetical protein